MQFDQVSADLINNISACVISPGNYLWLGSDELTTIERLSSLESNRYGEHKTFAIADFIDLPDEEDEVDIEGMDYSHSYLWFTGSHSTKRKNAKGKNAEKDIQRLTEIISEANRYTIARIPLVEGELLKSCNHPDKLHKELTAATLQRTESGNILIDALQNDEHLGAFVANPLPSKENGFDIEGLAVHRNKLFLGLRGPVLRGWAIILEIEVEDSGSGVLTLKPCNKSGQLYKKYFLNLDGLGIRELCLCGKDLLILAGPTMDLIGVNRVFRLKHILEESDHNLFDQDNKRLEPLFDLPFNPKSDKAEGLALTSCLGQSSALLVMYDAPDAQRFFGADTVLADVFKL
ncbi:DUF3616 domain-containing protein [Oscillatoria sp. FACHB-1407]|uniref:DUF3616 domain-containing protein n=1 Tax=Oscillatoria sp. FACHB-1407 TaxID=2692847 RepID=UPI0018EFDF48|nr:DUF3616 domain-containing protein [Oscillatoria sp. FACHB-1407]